MALNRTALQFPHARTMRGYTVVELVVVVLIIAILAAGVSSVYVNMQKGQRLNTTMDKVVSSIYLARSLAISNSAVYEYRIFTDPTGNMPQTVGVFSRDTTAGVIPSSATPPSATTEFVNDRVDQFQIPSDMAISLVPAVSPMPAMIVPFIFNADGSSGQQKVKVVLTLYLDGKPDPAATLDRVRARAVEIYPGGMIKQKGVGAL